MSSINGRPLPPGWAATTLGEIGLYHNGRAFKPSDWVSSGRPIIRIQDLTGTGSDPHYFDGAVDPRHEVAAGDLLISWAATLGAYIWRGPPAVLNQHTFKVQSLIDRRFHYYAAKTVIADLYRMSHGSGMVHVTKAKFEATPIALPPLAEQARIVDTLDAQCTRLDASVVCLERIRTRLEMFRTSVLYAAMSGRLAGSAGSEGEETGEQLLAGILESRRAILASTRARHRSRQPETPPVADLPVLPSGWVWASIDQLCSVVTDGVHQKPEYIDAPGVPFVTVRNLTAGPGINLDRLRFISNADHLVFCQRARPERGDLLVSKDGTLGIVRAIRTDVEFSIFVSVALLKPVDLRLTNYIEIALESPIVQRRIVTKGSGIKHIHLEDLRRVCIPLPPLSAQRAIVEAFARHTTSIARLEGDLRSDERRIASLRQSLLRYAFEGHLVPQDPQDEPASILLDRIRASRAAAQSTCKRTSPRSPR